MLSDIIHRHSIDLILSWVLRKTWAEETSSRVRGGAKTAVSRIARGLNVGRGVELGGGGGGRRWDLRHIATDFSAGLLHALPYALSLAEENQASLSFLHVMPMVIPQQQNVVAETVRNACNLSS